MRSKPVLLLGYFFLLSLSVTTAVLADEDKRQAFRAPVDLLVDATERWLLTANELTGSVSLVDLTKGQVTDELVCGNHLSALAWGPQQKSCFAVCSHSGNVTEIGVKDGKLTAQRTIHIGYEPVGMVIHPTTQRAYVARTAVNEVVELDLVAGTIVGQFAVGSWSRYMALSPDGTRLAVGSSGEGKVYVIDTVNREVLYDESLAGGINLGKMTCDAAGAYVYFPWMVYRTNPITPDNIRRGWVLASRIGRVRLDGSAYREAISLDVPGMAVADPFGIAISPDQQRLVATGSGTHELLVYRLPDLPFVGVGGPGDLIDRKLMNNRELFHRVELGGRPLSVLIGKDNQTVYVVNDTRESIQIVSLDSREVVREIPLSQRKEVSLVHQGRELFYDGRRSLDQWYSCHTCHYNGGINSRPMDTWNDGSELTLKTVLPLYNLSQTKPWTWHGWQTDLTEAMQQSFTSTMQGNEVSPEQVEAILAFIEQLRLPPNPHRAEVNGARLAVQRGEAIFRSEAAGCANCHAGPQFTDGQIHDVQTGSKEDRYDGYNTPSLTGVYRKVRFLHDGRAKSLEVLLSKSHSPEKVSGGPALTEQQIEDLIQYLRTL